MPVRRAVGTHFGLSLGLALGVLLPLSAAAAAQASAASAKPATKSSDTFVLGGSAAQPGVNTPSWTLAPPDKRLPNPSPTQIQTLIITFATHERDFRQLLAHNYTYTESILAQALSSLGPDGTPTGKFQQVNNVTFVPGEGRQIVCTFCPQPSMEQAGIEITQDDLTDMFNMNMYTLAVDELPQYTITYLDHQPLDDITAFVFRVQPKQIVKGHRYFNGIVYVEDQHDMIVKSIGRVVPNQYDKHGVPTNTFLPFTVWRKEVDGKYWFPAYTLLQGVVPGGAGAPSIPMRMVIQFTNYRQFGSTSRIIAVQALPDKKPQPDAKKPKGPGGGGNQN
ncbi:MAG: hypothetical protein ACRD1C_09025 [Terriglobales bacterium]